MSPGCLAKHPTRRSLSRRRNFLLIDAEELTIRRIATEAAGLEFRAASAVKQNFEFENAPPMSRTSLRSEADGDGSSADSTRKCLVKTERLRSVRVKPCDR